MEWKDVSSYSQGERGKIDPRSFEVSIEGHLLWLSRGHRYYPGCWVIRFGPGDVLPVVIGETSAMDLDAAKAAALSEAYAIAECELAHWDAVAQAIENAT